MSLRLLALVDAQRGAAILGGLVALALTPSHGLAAHPHALWHVVHDLCVADRRLTGLPAPCLEVDLAAGYAVVPDLKKPAHLLLVPTRRLSGIEDPRVLEPGGPNYWGQAWAARRHLAARIGADPPRESVALAVNAIPGRSQDQLHIHISCVQPAVANALAAMQPRLGRGWSTHTILGRRWRVRTLTDEDLRTSDPFRLVAEAKEDGSANMGEQTLVVVGAQLPTGPGFHLLWRTADAATGDPGHGEYLLDEACSGVAAPRPPPHEESSGR